MNLPNALTVARIAAAPVVALLPFVDSWELRLLAFWLFILVAVTDYLDGKLARSRNLVTDLGRLLDPLADKLLLLATFVPMYLLVGSGSDVSVHFSHGVPLLAGNPGPMLAPREGGGAAMVFPLATPIGPIGLPWWILAVVLGRELLMTIFRQTAARRGVIIAAIGPAKWKTGFQWTWVGATFFWFAAATAAAEYRWMSPLWRAFGYFNGIVATASMAGAVALTLYSLWIYGRRYGGVFAAAHG